MTDQVGGSEEHFDEIENIAEDDNVENPNIDHAENGSSLVGTQRRKKTLLHTSIHPLFEHEFS